MIPIVSILVLLDDAYRLAVKCVYADRTYCFNPCSSGWCLPAEDIASRITSLVPFQSLFFWMMPTGKGNNFWKHFLLHVSILVLLDDAYRPASPPAHEPLVSCFNPCSSGWCLPAILNKVSGVSWRSFNPCSSGWCLPARWEWRCGTDWGSFNPCSSGWCLPAISRGIAKKKNGVSILVLLDDAYRL